VVSRSIPYSLTARPAPLIRVTGVTTSTELHSAYGVGPLFAAYPTGVQVRGFAPLTSPLKCRGATIAPHLVVRFWRLPARSGTVNLLACRHFRFTLDVDSATTEERVLYCVVFVRRGPSPSVVGGNSWTYLLDTAMPNLSQRSGARMTALIPTYFPAALRYYRTSL
jgi:hypothetical protein